MKFKADIKRPQIWRRFLFMLLFAFIFSLGKSLLYLLIIVQFLYVLVMGKKQANIYLFSGGLIKYLAQIMAFLAFRTERYPFPFGIWPGIKLKI
jgi:hypothetical protein